MASLKRVTVIVAGAGLAGLTAAHDLIERGANVHIVEAQSRVGGRVLTRRDPFLQRQHAEAGADLIDESQHQIRHLARTLGLTLTEILTGGFTGIVQLGRRRRVRGRIGWQKLERLMAPDIRAFTLGERRWDGAIARALGRESVKHWLDRTSASPALRATATAMRGFFLADPEDLSLLAMVDQFAEEGSPGGDRMFRVKGGNDRIAETLTRTMAKRLERETALRRVIHTSRGVVCVVETPQGLAERRADYLICALPATTLRDIEFSPSLPDAQGDAIRRLKYGAATKTSLQFARPTWRRRGPRAFGTNLPIGAIWDANEEQRGTGGILTLLAGGRASAETKALLSAGGPQELVRQIDWLGLDKTQLIASDSVSWDQDRWVRGGYAVFDPGFDPVLREWLARPLGRVCFAGEHTSNKWQGYMNGAVESGLRAASEVAAMEDAPL